MGEVPRFFVPEPSPGKTRRHSQIWRNGAVALCRAVTSASTPLRLSLMVKNGQQQ